MYGGAHAGGEALCAASASGWGIDDLAMDTVDVRYVCVIEIDREIEIAQGVGYYTQQCASTGARASTCTGKKPRHPAEKRRQFILVVATVDRSTCRLHCTCTCRCSRHCTVRSYPDMTASYRLVLVL